MNPATLIRSAMSALVTGWDAQVAAFNADPANLVDLESLPAVPDTPSGKAVYFGGKPDHIVFPAVEVQCAQVEVWNLSLAQASGDAGAPIVAVVWLEGSDGEVPALIEQAYGYAMAVVVPILLQPDAFGPHIVLDDQTGRSIRVTWQAVPAGDPRPNRTFERWRTAAICTFGIGDVQTG